MGLDMYLKTSSGAELGYWRKANAIHAWFVKNVQNGVDDCGDYPVSPKKLKTLLDLCEQVVVASKLVPGNVYSGALVVNGKWEDMYEPGQIVEDPSVAINLLPATDGFFFGSTHYDERYIDKLKDTIKFCLAALAQNKTVIYHSSW
jgi:hypothetical protein